MTTKQLFDALQDTALFPLGSAARREKLREYLEAKKRATALQPHWGNGPRLEPLCGRCARILPHTHR